MERQDRSRVMITALLLISVSVYGMFALSVQGVQLVLVVAGIVCLAAAWLLYHAVVTRPLRRITGGIRAMQETGRLAPLAGTYSRDLGVVVAGFNALAQQVEQQQGRLRGQIAELERVNAELGALDTLKEDFLETINHQLRTPVTSIAECVQLFQDGVVGQFSDEQRPFIQILDENAKRLMDLVEQTLDLSLLKSGRRPLQRQPSDLAALLSELKAQWNSAEHALVILPRLEPIPPVYIDGQAIQEVIGHLVRNAARHAPAHTNIRVETILQGAMAEVAVHNDGSELSPDQLETIFEPFSHVQQADAPGSQGSGLGLAFCRQVIERHRGTIKAESAPEHGTTFRFTVPLASRQFLFEEACRVAQERAESTDRQFGLLLIRPQASAGPPADAELMRRVEELLRRRTQRGDQFTWLDDALLGIVAVANRIGVEAMSSRLRVLLRESHLPVALVAAVCPMDGRTPAALLDAARRRLDESPAPTPAHAPTSTSRR